MSTALADRLTIAVCQHFITEVETVIGLEDWVGVQVIAFPSRCGRPPLNSDELLELTGGTTGEILVVGGACLCEIESSGSMVCKQSSN